MTDNSMTQRSSSPRTDPDATIDLQGFLKIAGLVETGGEAKFRIQNGEVSLNGEPETRRRKKLRRGDIIELHGTPHTVDWPEE